MLAIQCKDGIEKLLCTPYATSCINPNDDLAQAKCNGNGGFDQVLPYYSGCYPTSSGFWEDYAPATFLKGAGENACDADIAVPALNLANLDFEDSVLEITEWGHTDYGGSWYVRQKCDRSDCAEKNRCKAYEGECYALISAGDTKYNETDPNELWRSDFRVPEVDTTGACGDLKPVEFCLSFAMRFEAKDYCTQDKDDLFTVEVKVDGDNMLFNETIRVCDVGDQGISEWEVVKIPLPQVPIGQATYFMFRAMTTNVGDYGLDSIGYIDDMKIAACE
jgi:hypothetical protein